MKVGLIGTGRIGKVHAKNIVRFLAGNDVPSTAVFWGEAGATAGTAYKVMWDRYTGAFVAEMQAFARAITRDEEPPVTGMDGLYPVLMAAAAAKSLREQRTVRIDEVAR